MISDMYTEMILDYYRNPRNKGTLKNPDVTVRDSNPLCGDVIEMQMKVEKGKIKDIKFSGSGCAISTASASMLTEVVKGKSLKEAEQLDKKDVLKLLGIDISAVRLKCALLPLKVLKMAVYSYKGRK